MKTASILLREYLPGELKFRAERAEAVVVAGKRVRTTKLRVNTFVSQGLSYDEAFRELNAADTALFIALDAYEKGEQDGERTR